MKRRYTGTHCRFWLTSAAVAGLYLASAGATISRAATSRAQTFTVGVLINGIAMYPYYTREFQGIKAEVSSLQRSMHATINLDVEDSQNNPQTELSDAQNLILRKPQVVLFTPTTYDAGVTIVRRFNAAHIPVITMDRAAGSQVLSYVGYDNVKLGEIMAQLAVQALHEHGVIAEETGALGSANQIARSQGWGNVFSKHAGIRIAANLTNGFDPGVAYSVTKNILRAHPNVQLILSQDDLTAIGVAKAAAAAHRTIQVIGLGAAYAGLSAIQKSQLYGTVLMEPYSIGTQALRLAVNHLTNASVPKQMAPAPYTIITAGNVGRFSHDPAAGW